MPCIYFSRGEVQVVAKVQSGEGINEAVYRVPSHAVYMDRHVGEYHANSGAAGLIHFGNIMAFKNGS